MTAERSDAAKALTAEALHREAFGQNEQRRELLQRVAAEHPYYAPAKWHQGLVQRQDRWIKAEDVPGEIRAEGRISDYRRIRDRYPQTRPDRWPWPPGAPAVDCRIGSALI